MGIDTKRDTNEENCKYKNSECDLIYNLVRIYRYVYINICGLLGGLIGNFNSQLILKQNFYKGRKDIASIFNNIMIS